MLNREGLMTLGTVPLLTGRLRADCVINLHLSPYPGTLNPAVERVCGRF
jgi:hypothetical protein